MKGRFAPSPTGRMHLGNVYSALLSWLSARSQGGTWVLRIEDLDPQRSRLEYARQVEEDLRWLGLDWDEGGLDGARSSLAADSYVQSQRGEVYAHYLQLLTDRGLTYPCYCTRADIMATQAPHESDGRVVYAGTCRPRGEFCGVGPSPGAAERLAVGTSEHLAFRASGSSAFGASEHLGFSASERLAFRATERSEGREGRKPSTRLIVPDADISFVDGHYGPQTVNLAHHCGDFVLRRADGAWAYQLAVVVDDALMGITEVVRGRDLLLSAPQQIYLYQLLGFDVPRFCHLPLLCNAEGQRLCKRDKSLDLGEVRRGGAKPQEVIGRLAHWAGLIDREEAVSPGELVADFAWRNVPVEDILLATTC